MNTSLLQAEALRAVESIRQADIVIGMPSYNNARTIGHVVRAANAGLAKYFPGYTAVVVNSDGGSTDNTREEVLSAQIEDSRLMLLSTPIPAAHRLSLPYHGIPGKGSAFRLIFQLAERLGAKACAVVDSDLRSITPEWIDLLVSPLLSANNDLVTPYYYRHKYDGTITNSIVYPLTRALYGLRIRQPIGGEFGLSARLVRRYLQSDEWETDVARYGIDIWMTTTAIAEGFQVAQSFLGAKLHDAKDPGSDLTAMLHQVVGSVFALMGKYSLVWRNKTGSKEADLFGFRFDVGLEPISVNVDRMIHTFRFGCEQLREVWAAVFQAETLLALQRLSDAAAVSPEKFHINDQLWAKVVLDFAVAFNEGHLPAGQLLSSLTPLYLGRVASFVLETESLSAMEVEQRIERLCLTFESLKPYLIERWNNGNATPEWQSRKLQDTHAVETREASLEV